MEIIAIVILVGVVTFVIARRRAQSRKQN